MAVGARSAGVVNGPAGPAPRLVQNAAEAVPAVGNAFVTGGRDATARVSDPAAVGSSFAVAKIGPVPTGEVWRIERLAVSSTSGSPTTCSVYVGSIDDSNLVDYSVSGNRDIADEVQPIIVPGGSSVWFRWVGMTDNARGTARIQYEYGSYQQVPFIGG